MRRVIVDADACPGKEIIIRLSDRYHSHVVLVASLAHVMSAPAHVEVKRVDAHPQAVDTAIMNIVEAGDVVITQDWGLAAMCLAKGAVVLSPQGYLYDQARIDFLLEFRHAAARHRRQGGRQKGPAPRNAADDRRLEQTLAQVLGNP